ncbi:MAG: hypothetical protein HOQ18_18685, partial [Dermatophilaceae bacterium]|nr:hypothetical protein [Dermatophilaceae bacterium]
MRQRMERLLAAGVAASLGCAVLTGALGAVTARADDGSTVATPSPTVPPSLGFGPALGATAPSGRSPTDTSGAAGGSDGTPARTADPLTTLGGLGGVLVTPLFERLLLAAGAVVTAQQAEPAGTGVVPQDAQPGQPGGSADAAPDPAPDPATLQPGGGT